MVMVEIISMKKESWIHKGMRFIKVENLFFIEASVSVVVDYPVEKWSIFLI